MKKLIALLLAAAMLLILASSSGFFVRRGTGEERACEESVGVSAQNIPKETGTLQPNAEQPESFASRYGLTPREAQALACLLKGHSQQRIQEELGISKGTASFHIQNVYAKCGVHSRQELIDLHEQES